MTYEQIFEVLKQKMAEVLDELDVNNIDASKSMKDYGADSLETVEIVSRTVKALQIKAPRTEIMAVKSLDGLINIFVKYSEN